MVRTIRRRSVILCHGTARRGRRRLWAFGYEALAALTGLSEGSLRNMVAAGTLDPANLEAVVELTLRRGRPSPSRSPPP